MTFSDELLSEHSTIWGEMLESEFLDEISNGELTKRKFNNWLEQDFEFVRAALPFVSAMKPKAPVDQRKFLSDTESALFEELELFEERADALGVDVTDVDKNLTTQSYINFLVSTAYREDYCVSLTVYWTAERAYHESWKLVEPTISDSHDWYPFVQNWAGEEFAQFVDQLEDFLNEEADHASDKQRKRMREFFKWTIRYEIAFWDMAYGKPGEEWLRTDR